MTRWPAWRPTSLRALCCAVCCAVLQVPAGEGRVGEGGGPDMLTLACHAVTVLCRMANPSVEAIGKLVRGGSNPRLCITKLGCTGTAVLSSNLPPSFFSLAPLALL